jgi:hypothetical protein
MIDELIENKDYEKIKKKIEYIKEKTKKSESEIIREIEKLRREFDTIITNLETIVELYMNQLGLERDDYILSSNKRINELNPGEYVNLKVVILSQKITPKVGILRIKDDTGVIRAIAFDTSLIKGLNEGEEIEITDAFVRDGKFGLELVIGKRTKIKKLKEVKIGRKNLSDLKDNELFEGLVLITRVYEPKEVEREFEGKLVKKIITPVQISDGLEYKTAYLNYKFEKENEGKCFLIRGKAFKGKDEKIRINIISLIEPDFEEELKNLISNN